MKETNRLKGDAKTFENVLSRECFLRIDEDTDDRTVRGVLATELPVVVFDWYRWEAIREVLLIDGMKVPKKMPLLDAHSRYEVSDIKGSVTNAKIVNDPKLGRIYEADNVFSTTADKEYTLVKEGHLDSTSIGYRVSAEGTVRIEHGGEANVNGKIYKNDYADKLPFVIRKKSEVIENSLVPIGADSAAKFRSMFYSRDNNEIEAEKLEAEKQKHAKDLFEIDAKILELQYKENAC